MMLLYRVLAPFGVALFLPGLLLKLVRRPGHKRSYWERFGIFSKQKAELLKSCRGATWIHAVSVGEVNVALSMLKKWMEADPGRRFVVSTTTTTGQELAMKKVPEGVPVFFCPLDLHPFVMRALSLLRPSALVVFETEIWPDMICSAKAQGVKLALVNARISDRSAGRYRRLKAFFAPVLESFDIICAQTERDMERLNDISPRLKAQSCGNMKFDLELPAKLPELGLGKVFGDAPRITMLAASTHRPEERLVAESFLRLRGEFPALRLVIVPRHAERAKEICGWLESLGVSFHQRSKGESSGLCDCLLADTTGELLAFMASSDIVVMGKTLCGNNEGQNIIEPASLGKAIICGAELRNFRQAFDALRNGGAVEAVASDSLFTEALRELIRDTDRRAAMGAKARKAICAHKGATERTIKALKEAF